MRRNKRIYFVVLHVFVAGALFYEQIAAKSSRRAQADFSSARTCSSFALSRSRPDLDASCRMLLDFNVARCVGVFAFNLSKHSVGKNLVVDCP
jgi:hypothetical protein